MMPLGSVFSIFFVNGKSPKLPTIQQDYLQVVYLNITYCNEQNLTVWRNNEGNNRLIKQATYLNTPVARSAEHERPAADFTLLSFSK